MKLHEGIREAIRIKDESIIYNYQFINILSDFQAFSDFPQGKEFVKLLCDSKYLNAIIGLRNSENQSTEYIINEIDRIAYAMSGDYNVEFDLLRYCCESIAYGLGILNKMNGYYSVDNFKHAAFIGRWNFRYKKDREVCLEIFRNYKAKTSTGIEFDWEPVSDYEINIYLKGIVSYRGMVSCKTLKGTATRIIDGKMWEWDADKQNETLSSEFLSYSTWKLFNMHDEVDDIDVQFFPSGILNTSNGNNGFWYIDEGMLLMSISNGFISYSAMFNNNRFSGIGKNKMGYEWKIVLKRI